MPRSVVVVVGLGLPMETVYVDTMYFSKFHDIQNSGEQGRPSVLFVSSQCVMCVQLLCVHSVFLMCILCLCEVFSSVVYVLCACVANDCLDPRGPPLRSSHPDPLTRSTTIPHGSTGPRHPPAMTASSNPASVVSM